MKIGDNAETRRFDCDHLQVENKCWENVINKIDECIPGRGSTVGKIYTALLEVTCQDKGIPG